MLIARQKRWLGVFLALPGVAAILLPFSEDVSPWRVIRETAGMASGTSAANFILMAIPFLVALTILDWQVRRARAISIGT